MTEKTTRNRPAFAQTVYRDTGCRLHPSCLRCPEPRCVFDVPEKPYRRMTTEERDARDRAVWDLRASGETVEHIRETYRLAGEDYRRIIERERERRGEPPEPERERPSGRIAFQTPTRHQVEIREARRC